MPSSMGVAHAPRPDHDAGCLSEAADLSHGHESALFIEQVEADGAAPAPHVCRPMNDAQRRPCSKKIDSAL